MRRVSRVGGERCGETEEEEVKTRVTGRMIKGSKNGIWWGKNEDMEETGKKDARGKSDMTKI